MDRREKNKKTAQETLDILKKGYYLNKKKEKVAIEKELIKSIRSSVLFNPKKTNEVLYQFKRSAGIETKIEVVNETTLYAANRLKKQGFEKVLVLNFASAKHPGGGFINGSMAQEESIAIASGLYPCLNQMNEMYEYNKKMKSCLYSDYMIYSPNVPVFRDDFGNLLDEPYDISVITSPAVNAGVVRKQEPNITQQRIHQVMEKRIEKILAIGLYYGYEAIVLGAFGCGVFKNRPVDVASYFKKLLLQNKKYENQYKHITFAVWDNTKEQENITPFKRILG